MRVLQVCAEIFPLLKTGGLADVAAALPLALRTQGAQVRVLLPGFAPILHGLEDAAVVAELRPPLGMHLAHGSRLLYGWLPACQVHAYVIDAPAYFRREGGPYDDHGDNHLRFGLLGWVAAALAQGMDGYWRPEVVHSHDWHAALAPAYLRAAEEAQHRRLAGTVYTVHNLAYQGMFAAHRFGELGLPGHFYALQGLEFHGHLNFMKGGLVYANRITTVSPSYAREIQSPEQGVGLDGLLRSRAAELSGILNGVDPEVWHPSTDRHLAAHYDADDLSGKAQCKAALQAELGLATDPGVPLACVVSRLAEQKGLHLVLQALPRFIAVGGQFALLGSGEAWMESAFRQLAEAHPESVAVRIGYDEPFAHRLIAGSDVILVPSRYEPCGLTQLYGLQYGTLPLVRRVGGLADTVADTRLETIDSDATGFVFDAFDADALVAGARRALALFRRPADWRLVQQRGMRQHWDWTGPARQYLHLYRSLVH
jgi:starch synthase